MPKLRDQKISLRKKTKKKKSAGPRDGFLDVEGRHSLGEIAAKNCHERFA